MPPNTESTGHAGTRRKRKSTKEERVCSICSKSFSKAEHLNRHFRSHTKEKPFQCTFCDKTYTRHLLRHVRSHEESGEAGQELKSFSNPMMTRSREHMAGDSIINGIGDLGLRPVAISEQSAPGQVPLSPGLLANRESINITPPNSYSADERTPSMLVNADSGIFNPQQPLETGLRPVHMDEHDGAQESIGTDLWNTQLDIGSSPFFAGEDFDLDAMNLSILQATSQSLHAMENTPWQSTMDQLEPLNPLREAQYTGKPRNHVQRRWHTFSEHTPSGHATPTDTQERVGLNDDHRQRLVESLGQRVQHGILPSTSFLNLCIQAYFSHFQPVFPMIHAPTFWPCKQNSVLLLSICSIGSLFLCSPQAISHGISLFERLNKAILASWENYTSKSGYSAIAAIQATVVGQTFGYLFGRPKDLNGIDMFHGSIITWARKAKLYDVKDLDLNTNCLNGEALNAAWNDWIRVEEKKRIVLALYIHDAELAKLHHREPFLRFSVERLPKVSTDDIFAAPNAGTWKRLLTASQLNASQPSPQAHSNIGTPPRLPEISSGFHLYAMLETIGARARENRASEITWPGTLQECEALLAQWYEKYSSTFRHSKNETFCFAILWHLTFMDLHADFDALERSCGREGEEDSRSHIAYATSWAQSADAKRCLLHATLIQRHFQSMEVGTEPAIHVPMALYYCGLTWYCYAFFGNECQSNVANVHFPELQLVSVDERKLCQEVFGKTHSRDLSHLFHIIDLLQRINHWKVSHCFASTLLSFVEEAHIVF